MEDIEEYLKRSAEALQAETQGTVRNENPTLALVPDVFNKSTDLRKEYSAFYRLRLNTLKPLVKAAATKRWGTDKLTYQTSLLNLRAGVMFKL